MKPIVFLALLVLTGCAADCDPTPSAEASRARRRHPGSSGAAGPSVILGETTQLFDGIETAPTANPDWGRYAAFPGIAVANNGDYVAVFQRAAGHSSEDGAITVNRSLAGDHVGRVWMNKLEETPEIANDDTAQESGVSVTRLSDGSLGLINQLVDTDSDPSRSVTYRNSADNGATWSAPVAFPAEGTNFHGCGCSPIVDFGSNVFGTATYRQNDAQSGYTALWMRSTNAGASWSRQSTIAETAGVEYEEPYCRVLANGRLLCLVRDDVSTTIFSVYSDDSGATWGSPSYAFPGWGKPAWVQTANGTLIATTREGGAAPNHGILWYSYDSGGSWIRNGQFQYEAEGTYEYADLFEISNNLVGIFHAQERQTAPTGRTFLLFTEVGVGLTPPTRYRHSHRLQVPTGGDSYASYADTNLLDGATSAIFHVVGRMGTVLGGTQVWFSQDATNQRGFTLRTTTGPVFLIGIASSLTVMRTCTLSALTLQAYVDYVVDVYYYGAGASDAARLRVAVNGVEQVCTYSGTIPASMTSPAAAIVVGSDATAPTTNDARDVLISNIAVYRNPGECTGACATAFYNGREPMDLTTYQVNGVSARSVLTLNNTYTDAMGILPAPSITGSLSFSTAWPL